MANWLTNDPLIAKRLNEIETAYTSSRLLAEGLCLSDKVLAYREAKRVRSEAMQALRTELGMK